jgi:hypothetical protein
VLREQQSEAVFVKEEVLDRVSNNLKRRGFRSGKLSH